MGSVSEVDPELRSLVEENEHATHARIDLAPSVRHKTCISGATSFRVSHAGMQSCAAHDAAGQ